MKRTAAVVLAAGGSSRMGRPKQSLAFRGRTLLQRAVDVALTAGCEPIVLVLGAAADLLLPEVAGLPVVPVTNPDWEQGLGTSIRAGVRALPDAAEAVVFLAVDQPFVDAAHLRALADAHAATGRVAVASGYAGTVGVPALFTRPCFPALCGLDPDAGAKHWLARNPDRVAIVPFPAGAIDLDTPDEYERWTTLSGSGEPSLFG